MVQRFTIRRGWAVALALGLLGFLGSGLALADERHPLEPTDTSSPRATLESFLAAANEIHALLTAEERGDHAQERFDALRDGLHHCMDLSQEPEYLRERFADEVAVSLKEVLDRIELPPFEEIPDGGPDRWRIPHTSITIARITQGDRMGEYLFTAETVHRAPHYLRLVEHLPYRTDGPAVSEGFYEWFLSAPGSDAVAAVVDLLPDWTRKRLGRLAIWQWAGLVLTLLFGFVVVLLVRRLTRKLTSVPDAGLLRRASKLLLPLAVIGYAAWARDFIPNQMAVSGGVLAMVSLLLNLAFLIGLVGLAIGLFRWIAEVIIASPKMHPRGLDAQFTRLVVRLLSVVTVVVVFLEGGKQLGISLTTLLAGAGVGGLVLALSAQDVLKNLFGSMTIMLDRPFRVGERIVARGFDGFVEEIGMRSTKIRLLNGHVAWIPNDTMARTDIENIGRRPHIRQVTELPLPLDTPPEQAQQALDIVRGLLEDHEGMDPKFPPRVYLHEFQRDAQNIRIFYWYHPPDYWQFMAFNEKLTLRIHAALDAVGIRLALPANITYMGTSTEPGQATAEGSTPPTP